ncbi:MULTISPECIES: ROK family transcriptional regulator [unclassified Streptomyces]|uniref:ROK family transcriptional regulator n=1 Tax=unclassified Streptomyces TaxID=2593676 RepID=UPI002E287BFE|nr:ROK family transcriptional regulator [Streptomyces sp. NBC_00223]
MAERRGAALQRLRSAHEAAVLGELRRSGALSRAELIERVGLSRTTLFTIVSDLLAREAVIEQPGSEPPGGRGRPATAVSLNPRGAELIGVGLLRTRMHIVVANHAHEIVARRSAPLPAGTGPDERVAAVIGAVGELVGERGISLAPVKGIGLGLPGPVHDPADPEAGAMAPAAARIVTALGRHFGAPVSTDNNTRLAALAEVAWGAARGRSDIVYLRWSEGVGGGLVIDGRLVRGAHGAAGEIGHTSVDPQGPPCYCGGRGCLEGAIGLSALLAECRARGAAVRDADHLVALAASGDPEVVAVVREAAATAGRVLAALAAQTDPECVVIAGELAALDGLVLGTVREQLAALTLPATGRRTAVRASALGDDSAARGAVAMLLRAAGEQVDELLDRLAPPPGGLGSALTSGSTS